MSAVARPAVKLPLPGLPSPEPPEELADAAGRSHRKQKANAHGSPHTIGWLSFKSQAFQASRPSPWDRRAGRIPRCGSRARQSMFRNCQRPPLARADLTLPGSCSPSALRVDFAGGGQAIAVPPECDDPARSVQRRWPGSVCNVPPGVSAPFTTLPARIGQRPLAAAGSEEALKRHGRLSRAGVIRHRPRPGASEPVRAAMSSMDVPAGPQPLGAHRSPSCVFGQPSPVATGCAHRRGPCWPASASRRQSGDERLLAFPPANLMRRPHERAFGRCRRLPPGSVPTQERTWFARLRGYRVGNQFP